MVICYGSHRKLLQMVTKVDKILKKISVLHVAERQWTYLLGKDKVKWANDP